MPVTVHWDNPAQTILRYDFESPWTFSELDNARRVGYDMVDKVSHQGLVGVLLALPRQGIMPANAVTNALGQMRVRHKRTIVMVVVSDNPFVKVLYNTLTAVNTAAKLTFMQADNLDTARALVAARLETSRTPKD
ncbi:MAG: hypothetical protein U0694_06540 [Anaerolineae bacterium]